jgi:hypothetical protein
VPCRIISALVEEARRQKCYKIILDCSEHNVDFYAKSGFVRKEVQMVGLLHRLCMSGSRPQASMARE